mgnify:FL=1
MKSFIRPCMYLLGGFVLVMLSWQSGYGQISSGIGGTIDELQNATSEMWRSQIFVVAKYLFAATASLDLLFYGIRIVYGSGSFNFEHFMIQIGIYLLFFAALYFFDAFDRIVYGFIQIAQFITGQGGYSEGKIIATGLDYFLKTIESSFFGAGASISIFSLGDGNLRAIGTFLFGAFSAFLVLIGFFIIAVQYAYITVKTTIILSVGPFFLGFLPLNVSRAIGERYLSAVIKLGIEVFFFYSVLAFGMTALDQAMYEVKYLSIVDYYTVWTLLFLCYLTSTLLAKLPSQLSGFITQNINISLEKLLPER